MSNINLRPYNKKARVLKIIPALFCLATTATRQAVGIYLSFNLLYLLVAKGTQKPLRCISAGCGELVSKTNDHKGRPHSGVFVS